MIEKITKLLPIVQTVLLVAIVLMLVGSQSANSANLGASGTRFPNGISADSTSPSAGQVRGTTLTTTGASTLGGTVTVTTSNTATSSLIAGCMQMYATSTATSVRLVLSTVATSSPTYTGTNAIALVGWQYGTCPI